MNDIIITALVNALIGTLGATVAFIIYGIIRGG